MPRASIYTAGIIILFLALLSPMAHAQVVIPDGHYYKPVTEMHRSNLKSAPAINMNPLLLDYDVKFYKLDIEADTKSDFIKGDVTILVRVQNNPLSTLVFELYDGLEVERIFVNGEEKLFNHGGNEINIPLDNPLDTGEMVNTQIFYSGNTGWGMISETDDDWGVPVTYTSSEPFYSKDWFPCKENLEDKADSVHVFITTDYELKGVSNGILTATTYFPNGKVRYEWKSNYPIDFYLISIAIADYIEYNIEAHPANSGPIFIQNFLYDHPDCLDTYRDQINVTVPIMELFTELFGPYPFRDEKYGHYIWPRGGGMEHQTMTGMGNFEFYLVSHELGHSWFGNYVTCATWQDIWINEGFATYAQHLAVEMLAPDYAAEDLVYWFDRAMREPQGSVYVPDEDADDDARIFSGNLSYGKGMTLVHMIRFELQDDDLFFRILRTYISKYANDVATGMDFKEVLETESGMDFTDFFDQWYFGAGFPIFSVSWEQQAQDLTIRSTQGTSSDITTLFRTPMEYKIFHSEGDTTIRVFHDSNEEVYHISLGYVVDSIQIDPDNWILNDVAGVQEVQGMKGNSELFSVYPNPNIGMIHFRLADEEMKDVTVKVFNGMNQLIYSRRYEGCRPYYPYSFDLGRQTGGIYFMRFEYEEYIEIKKLIIE